MSGWEFFALGQRRGSCTAPPFAIVPALLSRECSSSSRVSGMLKEVWHGSLVQFPSAAMRINESAAVICGCCAHGHCMLQAVADRLLHAVFAVHLTHALCMQPTALQDGYSFNTLLYEGSAPNPASLTIRKPTAMSTIVLGAKSSANVTTIPLPQTCNVSSLPA